jgi:hypothetical protein
VRKYVFLHCNYGHMYFSSDLLLDVHLGPSDVQVWTAG